VLNARFHEKEAFIIGPGRCARRHHHRHQHGGPRTDIQLGGNADMRIRQALGNMEPGPERAAKEAGNPRRDRQLQDEGPHGRRALRARHRAP